LINSGLYEYLPPNETDFHRKTQSFHKISLSLIKSTNRDFSQKIMISD